MPSSPSPRIAASRRRRSELHRTQPAISQAIRRLEDELGDKLFDRTSRNGALTEAGVLLQEHAHAAAAPRGGGRSGGSRTAAGPPRPRRHRRQRGRRPLAAADHRAVHARASARAGRGAAGGVAADRDRAARAQPRLRRADVSAAGQGTAVDLARQRRARDARRIPAIRSRRRSA